MTEPLVECVDTTVTTSLAKVRASKLHAPLMQKAVGRTPSHRFWTKYLKHLQFYLNKEQIYTWIDIEHVTFKTFRYFHANKETCEKIIVWTMAALEVCKDAVHSNESILRSDPGKLISDSMKIIVALKRNKMPSAYNKVTASKTKGFEYNKKCEDLPWKRYEINEYLKKVNKRSSKRELDSDDDDDEPLTAEDLDQEHYLKMGWDHKDMASPGDETYKQRKKRIINQQKDNLYRHAQWNNLSESEAKICQFIACTFKTQFFIHGVFNAKQINWDCWFLNLSNRYLEEAVFQHVTIDTFDFQDETGKLIFLCNMLLIILSFR